MPTWPVLPGDILHVRKWTSYVKAFETYRITANACIYGLRVVISGHVTKMAVTPFSIALSFIEQELWAIEVYIAGIFDLFAPVTLIRWPSYTNLTRIPWRCTGYVNINFLRQGLRKLSFYRQTNKQTDRHDRKHEHAASRVVKKKRLQLRCIAIWRRPDDAPVVVSYEAREPTDSIIPQPLQPHLIMHLHIKFQRNRTIRCGVLRFKYVQFWPHPRYWIWLKLNFKDTCVSVNSYASTYQISAKSDNPRRNYIIHNFSRHFRGDFVAPSRSWVDRTKLNLSRTCPILGAPHSV